MLFKLADCSLLFKAPAEEISQVATIHKDNTEWNFEKRPGMLYVVVRAVSVGTNGNGDHFTRAELEKSYKTFIGKGVFVNHASNDVEKKRGRIVDAKWCEERGDIFVKCVLEVNAEAHPDLAANIKSGIVDSVSMGAVYDIGLPHFVTLSDTSVKSYFDVKNGDKLITHDGSIGEVVAIGKEWHENKNAYIIKAMKSLPVVLSEEHPLLVLKKENKFKENAEEFIESQYLKKGDYLLSNIYSKTVKTSISINEAKLLGWYLAEGSLCDKTGIELTLNNDDPLEYIMSLIKDIDNKSTINIYKHSTCNKSTRIIFYSAKIRNLIEQNVSGKSITKKLSQKIIEMEPEKQLALIGSYIDGDGCITHNQSTRNVAISLATGSSILAQQIPLILERSGVLASSHTVTRKPGKNSVVKNNFTQHTMYIGASFVEPLRNFSFKVQKLNKTTAACKRAFVYGNYIAVPIINIDFKKYTGWAYNIQVSSTENNNFGKNHSYHLNGLASHNCQVAYSNCSICQHAAKTTKDYCMHIKMHKGGAYNGRQVYEENHGIEFIEVSFVTTGADPQAKVLEVLARKNGYDLQSLIQRMAASNDPDFVENLRLASFSIDKVVLAGIRRANQIRGTK